MLHLCRFPFDIVYEILEWLDPVELLKLSRLTREFRRILMHRSSMIIWKTSFSRIDGLPSRPHNLSFPSWANLVFGYHCHVCGSRVKSPNWVLQIRLCYRCSYTCLVPSNRLADSFDDPDSIVDCVPSSHWSARTGLYFLIEDVRRFVRVKEGINGDLSGFISSCISELQIRNKHAAACKAWANNIAARRASDVREIRMERSRFISNRLLEMGYGPELSFLDNLRHVYPPDARIVLFHEHRLVRYPRVLTDKGWLRIRNEMLSYMMVVRIHRLRRAQVISTRKRREMIGEVWTERMMSRTLDDFVPSQIDLWELPELRHILFAPASVDVTVADVRSAIFRIEPCLSNWRAHHLNRLFVRFQGFLPPGSSSSDLRLAICVVSCSDPGSLHGKIEVLRPLQTSPTMWYPEYLHHMCNTHVMLQSPPLREDEDLVADALHARRVNGIPGCYRAMWSSDSLIFNVRASLAVRHLLGSLGLDFNTTLTIELDFLAPRVYCMTCRSDGNSEDEVEVYSWRQAVQHHISHRGTEVVRWKRLLDQEVSHLSRITLDIQRRRRAAEKVWRCEYCRDKPFDIGNMTYTEIVTHLRQWHSHDVLCAGVIGHYRDLQCPPIQPVEYTIQPVIE